MPVLLLSSRDTRIKEDDMIHLVYFIGCRYFYPSTDDSPRTDGVRNYGAVVRSLSDWLTSQLARTDVDRTIGYVTTGQSGFEHTVKDLLEVHNHRYNGTSNNPWNIRGGFCKWQYGDEAPSTYEVVYGSGSDGKIVGGESATWKKFLDDYSGLVDAGVDVTATIVYAIQQSQASEQYTNPPTLDFFNEKVAQHAHTEQFNGVNILEGLESNGSSII